MADLLTGDWLLLEEGLHPSQWIRVQMELKKAGIEHREESDEQGIRVWVPGNERNRWAYRQVEDLVRCFEQTMEAARRRDLAIRPYKRLERHVAFAAALRAHKNIDGSKVRSMMEELLHEFVWAQPLPNANHRSALLLIGELATEHGFRLPDEQEMIAIGNEFAKKSKPLISEKEFRPDPRREKGGHREAALAAVARLLSEPQS